MTTLTAQYTNTQGQQGEGLYTETDPNYGMGLEAQSSNLSVRLGIITPFFVSATVTPTIIDVALAGGQHNYYGGNFSSTFTTTSAFNFLTQVAGTITSEVESVSSAPYNSRYTLTGFTLSAQSIGTYLWSDLLKGGDTLIGGSGNDELIDYGTNNTFQGGGGYDTFVAASGGTNTAIFRGKAADYTISTSNKIQYDNQTGFAGYTVTDNVANRDGYTQMVNVSRLSFSDTNIALDIGPTQTAGAVYMLYQATFNRTPDAAGLGYWIAQVDKGANIINTVAATFVTSPEFVAKYGANPSNASYVDNLYQNVLHRSGDAGGIAYWNQQLDTGAATKAFVLEQFATLAEGAALVAPTIAHGIAYQQWVG